MKKEAFNELIKEAGAKMEIEYSNGLEERKITYYLMKDVFGMEDKNENTVRTGILPNMNIVIGSLADLIYTIEQTDEGINGKINIQGWTHWKEKPDPDHFYTVCIEKGKLYSEDDKEELTEISAKELINLIGKWLYDRHKKLINAERKGDQENE